MTEREIVRCPSCDGYGWLDDEGETRECAWCAGVGYVYRDARGVDAVIPPADYAAQAEALERLEHERLREMGYSGSARKPWEQEIRGENKDRLRGGGQGGAAGL
jgi:DnaJ-class molecular chaperone